MTFSWNGSGGVLKFVTCLQILFLKNQWSIVHFSGWRGWGVTKLVIFCGHHKYMTPKRFKKNDLQPIQLLEAVVSSSTSSQIHFDCIENNPQRPAPSQSPLSPHSTDDQTKSLVTFSWLLFFYVKKYSFMAG